MIWISELIYDIIIVSLSNTVAKHTTLTQVIKKVKGDDILADKYCVKSLLTNLNKCAKVMSY